MTTQAQDETVVPAVAERVVVGFTGDGEGEGEMSWGMWEIWHAMCGQHTALPLGGRAALEPGTTLADLAGELRYLMRRFPSMRTRLRFDAAGRPTQRLFATGEITLDVYDAAPDADPDEVAAAVEAQYLAREFDFADEWPVRMGAVRQHGRPAYLVTVMHHLVTDARGAELMLREVGARETAPVRGMQQLEQARWQGSAAGLRQNERALRHYERVLRAAPERQLPGPFASRSPRHWTAEFRSPALEAALPVIAARTGAGLPDVRLALFVLAMNRTTGVNPVVLRPVANNRFRPGLSDVVCTVVQAGVCLLDVTNDSVEQAVARVSRATMNAYKHAYFHPEDMRGLVARVSAERGVDVEVGCFVNDRVRLPPATDDQNPPGEEPAASSFHWTDRQDVPVERLFLTVLDSTDDALGRLCFEFRIDTGYISPEQTEAVAYAMESAAVEAAQSAAGPGADADADAGESAGAGTVAAAGPGAGTGAGESAGAGRVAGPGAGAVEGPGAGAGAGAGAGPGADAGAGTGAGTGLGVGEVAG